MAKQFSARRYALRRIVFAGIFGIGILGFAAYKSWCDEPWFIEAAENLKLSFWYSKQDGRLSGDDIESTAASIARIMRASEVGEFQGAPRLEGDARLEAVRKGEGYSIEFLYSHLRETAAVSGLSPQEDAKFHRTVAVNTFCANKLDLKRLELLDGYRFVYKSPDGGEPLIFRITSEDCRKK